MTERAASTLMRAARLPVVLGTLGRLLLVEVKTLKPGDEVILITSHQQLPKLEQRFERSEGGEQRKAD